MLAHRRVKRPAGRVFGLPPRLVEGPLERLLLGTELVLDEADGAAEAGRGGYGGRIGGSVVSGGGGRPEVSQFLLCRKGVWRGLGRCGGVAEGGDCRGLGREARSVMGGTGTEAREAGEDGERSSRLQGG